MTKKSTSFLSGCIENKMVTPKAETVLFLKQLARLAQKRSAEIPSVMIHRITGSKQFDFS